MHQIRWNCSGNFSTRIIPLWTVGYPVRRRAGTKRVQSEWKNRHVREHTVTTDKGDDLPRARRALAQKLDSLLGAGVRQIPRMRAPPEPQQKEADQSTPSEQLDLPDSTTQIPRTGSAHTLLDAAISDTPRLSTKEKVQNLDVLQREVAGCTLCDQLVTTRSQTVFGVGNPDARLCFFGEAPGADEDRLGEPFVGRAGQLLDKIISACTMKREDVYILNVVKCRPPGNRNPTTQEGANCRAYFERQFDIIRPEFICCLGAVAATTLLDTTMSIGRLRGTFHDYRGAKVLATYHPAYLLRNPPAKKEVWKDMKLLMHEMGIRLD